MNLTKRLFVIVLTILLSVSVLSIPVSATGFDSVEPFAYIVDDCSCGGAIVFVKHVKEQLTEYGDYGELWVNDVEYDLYRCTSCSKKYTDNYTFSGWYLP